MHRVGQDVAHDRPRRRDAERLCRLDVFELAQLERLAAQQTREPGPVRQPENDAQHQQADVGALGCRRKQARVLLDHHLHHQHRGHDQQHARDRIDGRVDVLDDVVDPAAKVSRADAQQHAERQRHQRRDRTDHQCGADALERLVEHVLPDLVGAQHVVLRREHEHRDRKREQHPGRDERSAPTHDGGTAPDRIPGFAQALRVPAGDQSSEEQRRNRPNDQRNNHAAHHAQSDVTSTITLVAQMGTAVPQPWVDALDPAAAKLDGFALEQVQREGRGIGALGARLDAAEQCIEHAAHLHAVRACAHTFRRCRSFRVHLLIRVDLLVGGIGRFRRLRKTRAELQ